MKNNSKEKPTIKESINRIFMVLSYINLIMIFPFVIEIIGLLTVFKDEVKTKIQPPLVIVGIIYYILLSLIMSYMFTKDLKNNGNNLLKNIIKLLIVTSIFLIIFGIVI